MVGRPALPPADLQALARYEFYVKLAIEGGTTQPFRARSLAPRRPQYATQDRARIIRSSRERYGARRAVVEDKITRWLAHTPGKRPASGASPTKQFVVT